METSTLFTVLGTVIGIGVGGWITWLVSYRYYKRAGDELRQASEELGKLIRMIHGAIEQQFGFKVAKDQLGKVLGWEGTGGNVNTRLVITTEVEPRSTTTEQSDPLKANS